MFASYASSIFRDTGAVMDPDLCAVVIGILQLMGSYTTIILIDKLGRKVCVKNGTTTSLFNKNANSVFSD